MPKMLTWRRARTYCRKLKAVQPEVILIGSGSEVGLCVKAQEKLKGYGVKARVVSMPSWNLFDAQDEAYRESVLPKA